MSRRGFTLIEVMVVLSILAIIAILSYNFFGSMMKEAQLKRHAAKAMRQIQIINDSYEEYVRQTGQKPTIVTTTDIQNYKTALVDMGILKEFPRPDDAWRDESGACDSIWSAGGTHGWYMQHFNRSGTAEADFTYYTHCIRTDICEVFNDMYTNLGTNISVPHWNIAAYGGQACSFDGGVNKNVFSALGTAY